MYDMTSTHVRHDSFNEYDMIPSHVRHDSFTLSHDSFTRVTWLIHRCDMTHLRATYAQVCECMTWLLHTCNMTHPGATYVDVWHDSFTRATWLIQVPHTCLQRMQSVRLRIQPGFSGHSRPPPPPPASPLAAACSWVWCCEYGFRCAVFYTLIPETTCEKSVFKGSKKMVYTPLALRLYLERSPMCCEMIL